MIAARLDLFAERWELAKLATAILQPVLLIALAAGLVLASAHLLTMLGTRWGRRRVSQKALVFSVVVHFSIVCGILALWPEAVPGGLSTLRWQPDRQPAPPEAFRVVTEPELDLAVTRTDIAAPPDRAVWNQLPDDFTHDTERMPVESPTFVESPDLRPEIVPLPEMEVTVTTPLPAPEMELPEPLVAEAASVEPTAPAAAGPSIDDVARETRDESAPPELQRKRSATTPDSLAGRDIPELQQRPEAAPIERIAPRPNIDETPTSVAGSFDEQATLHQADEGVEIVRPEGPVPAVVPTPGAAPAVASDSGASVETPLRPSMTRERSAASGGASTAEPVEVERVTPGVAGAPPRRSETPFATDHALARTETPSVERPQLGVPTPGGGGAGVPAPYRLRGTEERAAATKQFGGNAESERAVELSLQWLADNQTPDGFWDASEHGGGSTRVEGMQSFADVGKDADTGLTGLALLAFLGRGHTLDEGQHTAVVEQGLQWIVSQQRADGGLGGRAGATDYAYCHAMATFALAEAYALSDKSAADWLRFPVQRAVQHSLDTMTTDGGWRYQKETSEGDMSIFGWQLMALKSAELGGISFPKAAQDKMVRFLIARSLGASGGLAGYRKGDRPTPSMTAEALYCKQRLGIGRDNPACVEAVAFLQRSLPQRTQMNYYFWYYGSLAMRQYGGDEWTQWNDRLRDLLIQEQRQSGPLTGSWDPNDPWGRYGGRVYSTALATLCLEVYYRYGEQE